MIPTVGWYISLLCSVLFLTCYPIVVMLVHFRPVCTSCRRTYATKPLTKRDWTKVEMASREQWHLRQKKEGNSEEGKPTLSKNKQVWQITTSVVTCISSDNYLWTLK